MIGPNQKNIYLGIKVLACLGALFVMALMLGQEGPNSLSVAGFVSSTRALTSLSFPVVRPTSDSSEILEKYVAYLDYALEISKETDPVTSKKLAHTFQNLKSHYPEEAARFLKGLRFEMIQKLELMGVAPHQAGTKSPEMRRWVSRFVKEWYREADEHLFRAIAQRPKPQAD